MLIKDMLVVIPEDQRLPLLHCLIRVANRRLRAASDLAETTLEVMRLRENSDEQRRLLFTCMLDAHETTCRIVDTLNMYSDTFEEHPDNPAPVTPTADEFFSALAATQEEAHRQFESIRVYFDLLSNKGIEASTYEGFEQAMVREAALVAPEYVDAISGIMRSLNPNTASEGEAGD